MRIYNATEAQCNSYACQLSTSKSSTPQVAFCKNLIHNKETICFSPLSKDNYSTLPHVLPGTVLQWCFSGILPHQPHKIPQDWWLQWGKVHESSHWQFCLQIAQKVHPQGDWMLRFPDLKLYEKERTEVMREDFLVLELKTHKAHWIHIKHSAHKCTRIIKCWRRRKYNWLQIAARRCNNLQATSNCKSVPTYPQGKD